MKPAQLQYLKQFNAAHITFLIDLIKKMRKQFATAWPIVNKIEDETMKAISLKELRKSYREASKLKERVKMLGETQKAIRVSLKGPAKPPRPARPDRRQAVAFPTQGRRKDDVHMGQVLPTETVASGA